MRLDVAALERRHEDVDAFRGAEMPVDEDEVLSANAARAAADAIPDLAQEHLLPHLHPESLCQLFELVQEGVVAAAHARAVYRTAPCLGSNRTRSGRSAARPRRPRHRRAWGSSRSANHARDSSCFGTNTKR